MDSSGDPSIQHISSCLVTRTVVFYLGLWSNILVATPIDTESTSRVDLLSITHQRHHRRKHFFSLDLLARCPLFFYIYFRSVVHLFIYTNNPCPSLCICSTERPNVRGAIIQPNLYESAKVYRLPSKPPSTQPHRYKNRRCSPNPLPTPHLPELQRAQNR